MDRTEFHNLIREYAGQDPNVDVVARKVFESLTATQRRDALTFTLRGYVRNLMTEGHRHLSRPADQSRRGRTPGVFVAGDGGKYASARQRDLRDWELITGASCASPDGGRKFFGEFTQQEVRWLAQRRIDQAEALLRQANRYARVAEEMSAMGAERVKELDQTTLVTLMREDESENEGTELST